MTDGEVDFRRCPHSWPDRALDGWVGDEILRDG